MAVPSCLAGQATAAHRIASRSTHGWGSWSAASRCVLGLLVFAVPGVPRPGAAAVRSRRRRGAGPRRPPSRRCRDRRRRRRLGPRRRASRWPCCGEVDGRPRPASLGAALAACETRAPAAPWQRAQPRLPPLRDAAAGADRRLRDREQPHAVQPRRHAPGRRRLPRRVLRLSGALDQRSAFTARRRCAAGSTPVGGAARRRRARSGRSRARGAAQLGARSRAGPATCKAQPPACAQGRRACRLEADRAAADEAVGRRRSALTTSSGTRTSVVTAITARSVRRLRPGARRRRRRC